MTTTDEVREQLEHRQRPDEVRTFLEDVWRLADEAAELLPAGRDAGELGAMLADEVTRDPHLLEAAPGALVGAGLLAMQLELELGALGQVHLFAHAGAVEFILGYRGALELVRRSPAVRDVVARSVFDGDGFRYELGTGEKLVHRPASTSERGELTHVYAIARLTSGGRLVTVLDLDALEHQRNLSPAGAEMRGPWQLSRDEPLCAIALRELAVDLPLVPAARVAFAVDARELLVGHAVRRLAQTSAPMEAPPA